MNGYSIRVHTICLYNINKLQKFFNLSYLYFKWRAEFVCFQLFFSRRDNKNLSCCCKSCRPSAWIKSLYKTSKVCHCNLRKCEYRYLFKTLHVRSNKKTAASQPFTELISCINHGISHLLTVQINVTLRGGGSDWVELARSSSGGRMSDRITLWRAAVSSNDVLCAAWLS